MSTTDSVDLIPKPFSSYVKSVNGVQMRISASTEYSSSYAAWRACTSVSSRYIDSYQWIPNTSAAGWWMIDLGKKYPIGAFSFYEVRSNSRDSSIKDYTIDISLDGSTFKTIYSETLTEAPREVWQVSRKINTVYARYFRISILTSYNSVWCGILSYVQIFESEGYKCLFISNDQVYALKS